MGGCFRKGTTYRRHRYTDKKCEACGKPQPAWSQARELRKAQKAAR